MSLSTEQCNALRVQLDDAKSAYHNLMTGQAARVVVDQNGERVEFAVAQSGKLNMYISSLQLQLQSECNCGTLLTVRRPGTFIF